MKDYYKSIIKKVLINFHNINFSNSYTICSYICILKFHIILLRKEGPNTKKNGRGRTIGLGVSKKKKKTTTGKLNVVIPIDKMADIGLGVVNFVIEISNVGKKNAHFNVKSWRKEPEATLDKE